MARNEKPIAENRKARHDYFIDEVIEAGMVLTGTEVKSLRAGRVNLRDSFARFDKGELFLLTATLHHMSTVTAIIMIRTGVGNC